MADQTAKVSAIRGNETEVSVAACVVEEVRSSTIQPSLAVPVEEFQAASVKIEHGLGFLGFGSNLMTDFTGFGFVGGCAILHSLASEMALRIVSSGEIDLFEY